MQCAAVKTHLSDIILPPQICLSGFITLRDICIKVEMKLIFKNYFNKIVGSRFFLRTSPGN